jgi:predicted DNA-binding protein
LGANSEKITIRLTPDQVENIDTIMLNRDIRSRSKVIRMAIENFISENLTDENSQKVIIHLPTNTIDRFIDGVSAGDMLNLETGIQIAVDRYLNSVEDYHLIRRERLVKARLEQKKRADSKLHSTNGNNLLSR